MNIRQLTEELEQAIREASGEEYTFADWFGRDLTGQWYSGDIDCANQKLTSLKGAPRIVSGDFFCDHNNLTTLEYAPEEVFGRFYCSYNKLTSLKGAPESPTEFWCSNNKLTTLEGAPKTVYGDFDCSNNQLTSLEGSPKKVGKFWCGGNKLTSLKGAPEKVRMSFNCKNNPNLKSLDGIGQVNAGIYSDIEMNEEPINLLLPARGYRLKEPINLLFPARGYRLKDHELSSGARITTIWWRTQKEGMKEGNITYYLTSEHHTGSNQVYVDLIGDSLNNVPPRLRVFFPFRSTEGSYTKAENYNLNELKNIENILKDKNLTYNKEDLDKFLDFVDIMQSRINKLNYKFKMDKIE